jgi:hypothetical protein
MQPGLLENFSIKFEHLATGERVEFNGWVTNFTDGFASTWNPVQVYGRMDPLSTFQGTQRIISIGFDVVAGKRTEAIRNDEKMNKLIQFLYPVYDRGTAGSGIACNRPKDQAIVAAAPLLRLTYANLIQNNADQQGLVGYLEGVEYAPNLEAGQFLPGWRQTGAPGLEMVYQQLSVNLSFTVLHTHLTGWVKGEGNKFYFGGDPSQSGDTRYLKNFPHGGTIDPAAHGAAANAATARIEEWMAESPENLAAVEYNKSRGGGVDALARSGFSPVLQSDTETDPTSEGAGVDVAASQTAEITGEC